MDVNAVWPFPLSLRSKLAAAGYRTIASLHNISPSALARDIHVSQEEALRILKTLRGIDALPQNASASPSLLSGAKTAWDLLCYEKERKRISTSCAELDSLLGGGICLKEVTEICGAPGVGKTQFGMQLAVNVQIPKDADGVGGSAVYIDTEGSFMVERAFQMAQACVAPPCCVNGAVFKQMEESFNVDSFLSNIYYFRVCDSTEQVAIVNHLETFLEEHKEVKLVVVDSITFHFRHGFEDMSLRTRILSSMGQKLMHLAELHEVAIVLMNQVTTKFSGGSSKLVPALGESWSHACTNRLILYWANGERHAYMFKSPSLPSVTASFAVTLEGIRGLNSNKRLRSS